MPPALPDTESDVESSASSTTVSDTEVGHPKESADDVRTDAMFALTHGTVLEAPKYISPCLKAEKDKWYRPGKLPKAFFCPDCGKGLSRMDSLTRHRKTRHRIGRQWLCQDPVCLQRGKAWGRFDHYKRHMEHYHGVIVNEKDFRDIEFILDATSVPSRHPTSGPTSPVDQPVAAPSSRTPEENGHAGYQVPALSQLTGQNHTDQDQASSYSNVVSLDRLSRAELMRMIQSKTQECEQLQQKCKILTLEKNEYIEALRLSEQMRAQLEGNAH
ncbi:hypothetical protein F5B20DRAFT_385773 [Whalleya microplaca]|nr:hypothetical protein F5B20DRAFT_385773 [Whalleya microplaca]